MSNDFKPVIEDRFDRAARLIKEARSSKESSAPLDPSRVKAGDTVTLALEGVEVTDEVAAWERNPSNDHYRAYLAHDPDPFGAKPFRLVGNTAYTLTAHQPAPEPEREPGTSGTATVEGKIGVQGTWVRSLNGEDYFATHHAETSTGNLAHSDQVTDFVPDEPKVPNGVVIDPAAVDWRGLQSQMSVLVVGAEPFKRAGDILAVVRRELGIEATS